MSRKYLSAFVLGILLIAGLLAVRSTAQENVPASGPAATPDCCVGVIDFVRIFNDCLQIQHLNELIQEKEAKLQAEAEARQKAIEAKKGELEPFQPGTPDFESRRRELVQLTIEGEVWLKVMAEDLERRKFDWTRQVYEKAVQAAEEIAAQRGLAIILQRKEFNPRAIEPTATAIRRVIRERELVFADPGLDITDQVIRRLDEQYQAEGGRKSLWPEPEGQKPVP